MPCGSGTQRPLLCAPGASSTAQEAPLCSVLTPGAHSLGGTWQATADKRFPQRNSPTRRYEGEPISAHAAPTRTAVKPKGRNKPESSCHCTTQWTVTGCDRTMGSSLKRGLRSSPRESEGGEGTGLVTDEVILRLVEVFTVKGWVGVGLLDFVNQHSEKRLVSPG